MDGQPEETEVTSSAEAPAPAYSPHTQGFPPTSHPPASNPFSAKKARVEVKGPAPPTTSTTVSFLRPSKLEAGLGSTIFTKHSTLSPSDLDIKAIDGTVKVSLQAVNDAVTTTESEDDTHPTSTASGSAKRKDPNSSEDAVGETGEPNSDAKSSEKTKHETPKISESATTAAEEPKNEGLSYNAPPPVGFVFGSNLTDRVENISKGVANGDGHENGGENIAALSASSSPDGGKRKWESTCPVTTGEENESNVMQASCRLFAFDVQNSSWIERGRGQLRLNDRQEGEVIHSRLIVRTKGSLRLMLNTPVFPQMVIERSSEKCIKITGHEDGGESVVKLFLIQCAPGDTETLHSALEWRLRSITQSADEEEATEDSSGGNVVSESFTDQPLEGPVDSTVSPPKKPKLSP